MGQCSQYVLLTFSEELSIIPSFVADHLLSPFLPLCPTLRDPSRPSPLAFFPTPYLCLNCLQTRLLLQDNPRAMVARESDYPSRLSFSPCSGTSSPPSYPPSPSPLLSVHFQYLGFSVSHLRGTQKHSLLGNPQRPHTPKVQRGQQKPEWKKKSSYKTKTRYQHQELQSSQTQMPRHQHKNTINSNQYNTTSLEPNSPTTPGPEKCNTAKAQDNDFNRAIMNMNRDLNTDMKNSINEIYENPNK